MHIQDLTREKQLEQYARAMVAQTPIRSVLSFGLQVREETLGVMTLYASTRRAFEGPPFERAALLAEHAAIAVDGSVSLDRAENLEVALGHSRVISVAIGILMERHRISADQAFGILRDVSMRHNRRLFDVAQEFQRTSDGEAATCDRVPGTGD